MRRIILILAVFYAVVAVKAQSRFEVKDLGEFKLHSYITADPLGDISHVVEGKNALVVVEPAAFVKNIEELNAYIQKLGKPVEKVIVDYHFAGLDAFAPETYIAVEGMPEFVKGEVYRGMMNRFVQLFGNAIDTHGDIPTQTVAKNSTQRFAGVDFRFYGGASSDFPASSILIGGKAYYLHFTPVENAHISPLQITGNDAVEAYLTELKNAKASGATCFIGSHGMQVADAKAVNFQIEYLTKMQQLRKNNATKEGFVKAMKKAYPKVAVPDNLTAVAENLYK